MQVGMSRDWYSRGRSTHIQSPIVKSGTHGDFLNPLAGQVAMNMGELNWNISMLFGLEYTTLLSQATIDTKVFFQD